MFGMKCQVHHGINQSLNINILDYGMNKEGSKTIIIFIIHIMIN